MRTRLKQDHGESKAVEVKESADELFDYLQDIKIEIILEAEGEDTEAVEGQ